MIIDCHVHLNNYHERIAVSLDESLDKLQAERSANKVDYSLVLTSYLVHVHRPSTAQVVHAIEKLPFVGVVATSAITGTSSATSANSPISSRMGW